MPRPLASGLMDRALPSPAETRLDRIFAAIADPTRRRILAMLLEDDMAVTDVAADFEMSLAAISKHLVILDRAGLISRERRGRVTWCKLEPAALREATVWIQGFGLFEPVELDAFERFLQAELSSVSLASDDPGQPQDDDDDHDDPDEIDDPVQGTVPPVKP